MFKKLLIFSNKKVSKSFLDSDILFTEYTKDIEIKTLKYFDIEIDINLTELSLNLIPGNIEFNEMKIVKEYTKELLELVKKSIDLLERINNYIKNGTMFLTIYPLVIDHMLNENNLLKDTLERLYNDIGVDPTYIYSLEYYYTTFLKEHSLLLKNLINPKNENEINNSNYYLDKYSDLLNNFNNDISPYSLNTLYNNCQSITNNFKSFLYNTTNIVVEDATNFMLLPLLIDHLLRESNSYIKNLDYLYKSN